MFFRTPYNYDADAVSRETATVFEDESLAVQSERDECDINTIVHRFGLTGALPTGVRVPMVGDFVGISSYQEALHAVMAAEASFAEMPAEVRAEFGNNPGAFVDFCSDLKNLPRLRELGLAPPASSMAPDVSAGRPADASGDKPPAG